MPTTAVDSVNKHFTDAGGFEDVHETLAMVEQLLLGGAYTDVRVSQRRRFRLHTGALHRQRIHDYDEGTKGRIRRKAQPSSREKMDGRGS